MPAVSAGLTLNPQRCVTRYVKHNPKQAEDKPSRSPVNSRTFPISKLAKRIYALAFIQGGDSGISYGALARACHVFVTSWQLIPEHTAIQEIQLVSIRLYFN
jgi:hypothetical protein